MTTKLPVSIEQSDNALLAQIPKSEWDRIRFDLQPVAIETGAVLYNRQQQLDYVYFMQEGCVSLMIDFDDGFQAEAGLIGREGMVGVPLTHGIRTDIASAIVQTQSRALRLPARVFAREMAESPVFEKVVLRHAETLRVQGMQLAACNGHHGLDARLARCILNFRDRFRADDLPVTHEKLATLLSAHRPSISVAAKRLQRLGLIQYSAGHLTIEDRPGLEQAACECYKIIREHLSTAAYSPE